MVDLDVYKADSKDFIFTIKDSNDVAVNITGYTFYFTVKENATDDDGDAKIDKTITSHTDPANGQTTISLNSTDTNLPVTSSTQKYVYDVIMKDTSGKARTILNGVFIIRQRVRTTAS